ncbi:hypothetical protein OH76DRAFT_1562415 [Lentinus brumalis]|uniref:Uncharacterized protein n=1 Tax=Lentinus brumalis TaxID=2498619 RepID=A0A371CGJ0_9APHY|nr:hypothetical protein OH76DRAFT_1562415 [Polyporus brumalis]
MGTWTAYESRRRRKRRATKRECGDAVECLYASRERKGHMGCETTDEMDGGLDESTEEEYKGSDKAETEGEWNSDEKRRDTHRQPLSVLLSTR